MNNPKLAENFGVVRRNFSCESKGGTREFNIFSPIILLYFCCCPILDAIELTIIGFPKIYFGIDQWYFLIQSF